MPGIQGKLSLQHVDLIIQLLAVRAAIPVQDSTLHCKAYDVFARLPVAFFLLNGKIRAGAIIQGSGGIRKLRFHLPGKGARGGCRVCYVDFEQFEITYLLTAYAKKDRENLTDAETQQLRMVVKELQKEAARRYYHG